MKNNESQTKGIMNYLLLGMKINGLEALRLFKCWRLPARIKEIETEYGIKSERKLIKTDSGKYVAEYWIKQNNLSL
jgi:hypothetical protein